MTYVFGLLCIGMSKFIFFVFASYHTDETGRSWILFHQEHWNWAFALSIIGLFFIGLGIFADLRDMRKEKAPPQKSAPEIQKPQEVKKEQPKATPEITDLEATEKEEPGTEKKSEAPEIWEKEEFE